MSLNFPHNYSLSFPPLLLLSCNFLQSLVATQVWEVQLPATSERLMAVASKSPAERVHSQGRVLADRSTMYKYLNPNLVAFVTQAYDHVQKCECQGLFTLK